MSDTYQECENEASSSGGWSIEVVERCISDDDALERFRECLETGRRPDAAEIGACVREQLSGDTDTGPDPGSDEPSKDADDGGSGNQDLPITGGDGDGDSESDGDGGGFGLPVVVLVGAVGLVAGVLVGRALRKEPSSTGGPGSGPAVASAVGPSPLGAAPAGPPAPGGTPVGGSSVGGSSVIGAMGAVTPPVGAAAAAGAKAAAPTTPDPNTARLAAERDRLVGALIDVADEVRSEAVRGTIVQRLGTVGVEPVLVSPGDRFDPSVHRGVHAESASNPEQADTIAALDRPGWVDRGRVLRPPEVVVKRWDGGRP